MQKRYHRINACFVYLYKATLTGRVVDMNNKNAPIQTEYGGGGTREKLQEIGWSDNPTPFYFDCMQDGSFNNTKLFPGTNRISVEGAFVPLFFYLNTVPYVGHNNYNNRYPEQMTYSGSEVNAIAGQTPTLKITGKLPAKRSYWLGVGARTTYGLKLYNYTDIKAIAIL